MHAAGWLVAGGPQMQPSQPQIDNIPFLPCGQSEMYLLYLDDSGSADNLKENYLVLGGICVFERQVQYFTQELDKIADRLVPGNASNVEFHASEIFSGRVSPWKSMTKDQRIDVIQEVLSVVANSHDSARAFASVVHKASLAPKHPMEVAFEDVCSRFDLFLRRVDGKRANHS